MPEINVDDIATLVELSESEVLSGLGITLDPIPEILKDCPLRYAAYEQNGADYEFACDVRFILEEDEEGEPTEELKISVAIEVKGQTKEYSGSIAIPLDEDNTLNFAALFKQGCKSFTIAKADLTQNYPIPLPELINSISASLGDIIPEELEFDVAGNALLVIGQRGTGGATRLKKYLLGFGSNSQIDMGQIPIVGLQFPPEMTTTNANIEFLVALDDFLASEVKTINSLLEESEYPVIIKKSAGSIPQDIKKGASIAGHLTIGEAYQKSVFLPLIKKSPPGTGGTRSTRFLGEDSPITIGDNGVWLEMQKAFGPVYFNKVGLLYIDNEIHFAPEIVLGISDFKLFLNEISISSLLTGFSPSFNVDGFELEYKKDAIEIGGAFLRSQKEDYTEYAGMGVLKLSLKNKGGKPPKTLGLSAIGAYAFNEQPSFFLYAVLDFPLGGPPFFFVTGLAAGFGYNRSLTVPPVEEIGDFPLVAQAISGQTGWSTENIGEAVNSQLEGLQDYIAVAAGAGFLALGVKFTSFKLFDCFALLTIALDKGFEVNLLGSASLSVPFGAGKTPIVYMAMLFKATFSTEEGVLGVEAQLTEGSYILSEKCHLSGGYAFYTWFAGEHDGDFVITLGGYHPDFDVPDHYPNVPRLSFNWDLGPISIKGENYFALCAHAVMAGGRLEASYRRGKAKASFTAYADFLISWKPYHYDIRVGISVKASYGFLGPVRLGVKLHLWGPDFGGTAKIDVFLFSFKIKFGDQSSRDAQAIDWADFKDSFLPAAAEICNIAVSKGLVKQIKNSNREIEDILIINPKEFELVTNSMIPIKAATQGDAAEAIDIGDANTAFGIRPMAVPGANITSTHKVKITLLGDGNSQDDVTTDLFAFEPVAKQVPSGLWSEPNEEEVDKKVVKSPKTNASKFVENSLSGFRVVPKNPPPVGNTEDIDAAKLQYDVNLVDGAYAWNNIVPFTGTSTEEGRETIKQSVVSNETRDSLLTALGFNPTEDVGVSESVADDFVIPPQVQ